MSRGARILRVAILLTAAFRNTRPPSSTEAANGIPCARRYELEQLRTERLAIIARVGRIITAGLELNELLQTAADAIHQLLGYTNIAIPLLDPLQATRSMLVAFVLIAAAWIIVAGYTSINAVVKAELFPTSVRATGVGLPYAVTVSIFGGTAESIALWFQSIGHQRWFYYYLTVVIAASLFVYATMRDTKSRSAMGMHDSALCSLCET